ncbi:hypothetical protein KIN20_020538 [Parelaphostrongylus tenuis]|uniref:Uncharacterized protein n=1 Tax=Parelaphostrongylus tenuis TaxID=148309 RepID=A0AAD5N617_PARTN|nr:hypothetical protein KIN20_020538 [Parelaphostrongylus tenuis]
MTSARLIYRHISWNVFFVEHSMSFFGARAGQTDSRFSQSTALEEGICEDGVWRTATMST